jgi:hypothetical protein
MDYENMLYFVRDKENWISMEKELISKGIQAMTIYDVILDYILMDLFEKSEYLSKVKTGELKEKVCITILI